MRNSITKIYVFCTKIDFKFDVLKIIFLQNRHKNLKLCEEKQNYKNKKVSIYVAFGVSQMPNS